MSDSQQVRAVADVDRVVDCDAHVTEHQSDLLPYLEGPMASALRTDVDDSYGYISSFYPSAGFLTPVNTGKADATSVKTPADVREGMDLLDTDTVVLTPTQNLYLGCVQHPELAAALGRAYNAWLLDTLVDPSAGRYGACVVAPQRPAEAAAEIDDRADEPGVCAVFLPSGGVNPPLGKRQYDPIYEAAERAGLPVMMHNAAGTMLLSFPNLFQGFDRYLSSHAPVHAMQHMTHLSSMLTTGVPERFDVDFVVQEAGIGWVPYFERRFDHEYRAKREDAPILEKLPSEYLRDQFYFTSQPVEGTGDPDYVASMVELMGPDRLLFSSDYPHLDFDHSAELFRAVRSRLGPDAARGVYGETATAVFDL
ncbi:MAG: putative metal-dependent hydrolase [uncultured archaeon A07HB70]|nr:MAG: putative metal-dependent hydrolase [uncultured archaeon A07HB70]